jgi:hypothetical protein
MLVSFMPIINLPGFPALYELLFFVSPCHRGLSDHNPDSESFAIHTARSDNRSSDLVPYRKPIMGWNSVHRCFRNIAREKMT